MEEKSGIIFDMDGTLWNSAKEVVAAWNEIIHKFYPEAKSLTTEDMESVMGLTMDRLAQKLFPWLEKEKRDELLDACGEHENVYLRAHGATLYPDVENTLRKLRENYNLYIVSNCQSGYIEAFLDFYKFRQYFEDIECYGNNQLEKGDNIRNIVQRNHLTKAVYVGDIQGDYEASCKAGIPFIHAAYGFGTISDPVKSVQTFSDLIDVVKDVL